MQETPLPVIPDAPKFGELTSAEKRIEARLDAIGNKGKWSDPADDVFLLTELAKGVKLGAVAIDLGIDAAACRVRFDLLCPEKTAAEQAMVVKALRQRAIAARAA